MERRYHGRGGLGALVAFVITSSVLDTTGILAMAGFFVIPYRRKQAKARLKEKIEALCGRLLSALTIQFGHEAGNGITRMKEGIAPDTRLVHSRLERIDKALRRLEGLRQRISALSARAERI